MKRFFLLSFFFIVSCQKKGVFSPPVEEIGFIPTPGYVRGIFLSNEYAYLADGEAGLLIVDISNPEEPALVGRWEDSIIQDYSRAAFIFENDTILYLADSYGNVPLISVKDPENPRYTQITAWARPAMDVDGFILYDTLYCILVTDLDLGLVSFDRWGIRLGNDLYLSGSARGIFRESTRVYIATGENGISVVDCSNPFNKRLVQIIDLPGDAQDVWVEGDLGFASLGGEGVAIFKISDTSESRLISRLDLSGFSREILLVDSLLFVAAGSEGLVIIDVSSPKEAYLYYKYDCPYAYCLNKDSSHIYLGTREGLHILEINKK